MTPGQQLLLLGEFWEDPPPGLWWRVRGRTTELVDSYWSEGKRLSVPNVAAWLARHDVRRWGQPDLVVWQVKAIFTPLYSERLGLFTQSRLYVREVPAREHYAALRTLFRQQFR